MKRESDDHVRMRRHSSCTSVGLSHAERSQCKGRSGAETSSVRSNTASQMYAAERMSVASVKLRNERSCSMACDVMCV